MAVCGIPAVREQQEAAMEELRRQLQAAQATHAQQQVRLAELTPSAALLWGRFADVGHHSRWISMCFHRVRGI